MAIGPDLLDAASGLQGDTVELRREIHKDPELGLELPATQAKILEALSGLGYSITTGESTTSIVADLVVNRDGPTTLLRADMDALPLQEDLDVAWKSMHEQRMHACGHDSHVAMLVSAARLLSEHRDQLPGNVRLMFQPGEEGFHGARYMIEEGVLDDVDRAFAIHVITPMPAGMFFTKQGPLMASADRFDITIKGRGGHASMPADAIDPIPAAAQTILGLHAMVGRVKAGTDAAVLTVGHLEAGTTNNIIPETARMEGTLRTFDEKLRAKMKTEIERVATNIAAAHNCACDCQIDQGYPVTSNHAHEVDHAEHVATAILGDGMFHRLPNGVMGAEDFSYVLNEVPGSMAFLGVAPEGVPTDEIAPNHSNYMTINEDAMAAGVAMYAGMALSPEFDG